MNLDGIRTILVPPDIVPVQRRSPLPARKRTPWHPQPDGVRTERPGAREWFGDHVFVESQDDHRRAGYGGSITAHACCAVLIVITGVAGHAHPAAVAVHVNRSLVMPVISSMVPAVEIAREASASVERHAQTPSAQASAPERAQLSPPPAAAAAPLVEDVDRGAPVEAPSSIPPDRADRGDAPAAAASGVAGGAAAGVPGGAPEGSPSGVAGPLRAGNGGIAPPRKIKDVKPIYPEAALAHQEQGIVIVEATIGPDGRVASAHVLRSVPSFDEAALAAVRQWEYAPSTVNGVPVSVIMTIVVKFGLM